MVMKEFSPAGLHTLLDDIRSALRLQVVQFPRGGPHRLLSESKTDHRRREKKKLT
jgi:hypothetical protein